MIEVLQLLKIIFIILIGLAILIVTITSCIWIAFLYNKLKDYLKNL